MRWKRGYRSGDVEVRKGGGFGGGGGLGALGLLLPLVRSRFGIVGVLLAIGALYLYSRYSGGGSGIATSPQMAEQHDEEARSDPRVEFLSFVLDDVQGTWASVFKDQGRTYDRAKMVIFEGATQTGCGYGESATGPFYCPLDQRVYLDLSFFKTLEQRLGAKGDFAQAYVVAHEIGHHVQKITGTMQQRGSGVALELQADCYAGVWASSTAQRDLLEAGDVEEAMTAAAAVGDDHLQKMSTGTVQPEKWTHGSSKQRTAWFKRGMESGDPRACDTFNDATAQK